MSSINGRERNDTADIRPVPGRNHGADRVAVLPAGGGARLRAVLGRALRRRCPYCGRDGIFEGWFALRERCPTCDTKFVREDGYFLGAYAINLIVAEIIGLGGALLLIFGTRLRDAPLIWQEVIAVAFAVAMPILFFPYSRTLWMALDLLLDPPKPASAPPPNHPPERRASGARDIDRHRPTD
jgi:uncharacterized protein (DUF983 family)